MWRKHAACAALASATAAGFRSPPNKSSVDSTSIGPCRSGDASTPLSVGTASWCSNGRYSGTAASASNTSLASAASRGSVRGGGVRLDSLFHLHWARLRLLLLLREQAGEGTRGFLLHRLRSGKHVFGGCIRAGERRAALRHAPLRRLHRLETPGRRIRVLIRDGRLVLHRGHGLAGIRRDCVRSGHPRRRPRDAPAASLSRAWPRRPILVLSRSSWRLMR